MLSPGGLLGIESVEVIERNEVTSDDARYAGYASLDELLDEVDGRSEGEIYRVRFHRIGEDPRVALRNDDNLTTEDVEAITRRLNRLDRSSRHGIWTRDALLLIERFPGRRAPDLAAMVSRETQPFKTDIRKLKSMGLTESLEVGYRLSPRGEAFLRASDP